MSSRCCRGPGCRHAWDVWGPGDNLGTLNRLTGPVVAAAAAAVRTGERVGLTLPLGLPDPPFFGRQAYRHSFAPMGQTAWDDYVDGFYLQCSSQWDGLRHVGSGPDGWYGGWRGQPEADLEPLGIQHWAQRGIIGRGVLVDLAGAGRTGYDPFARVASPPATSPTRSTPRHLAALRRHPLRADRLGRQVPDARRGRPPRAGRDHGDRVRVQQRRAGGQRGDEPFPVGRGVTALPCDNPSVEVVPADPSDGSLHRRLIPHLGFAIGELFDFARLARRA